MISIKGFYSVPKLNNNQDNSTAIFGELSQYASTFTRDLKTFAKGASQVNFCLFSCKKDGAKFELTQAFSDLACEVGEWAYETGPTITNINTKNDFAQMLQNHFGVRINTVTCGELVADSITRMPEWISWDTVGPAGVYRFKIWLSSVEFETSYDEFEILIVPPVDRIDKLFQPYPELIGELNKNTLSAIHDRMTLVRNKCPETITRTEMVEVIDKTNTNNRVSIGWTALIYGPFGDTIDNIKDAIKLYINNNSTNTESDWRALIPDLYNTTCFYVIPNWERFAIRPRLAMPGIHSPVFNSMANFNRMKAMTSTYLSTSHLETNLECTFHRYKDIALNIVGGEQNRLGLFKFSDYFADYIAQESTNEDFNRQTQATKDITNLLTVMLKKIDTFETDSNLPINIRLVEKHNQKFLVSKMQNVEYYILMKPTQQS